MSWLALTPTRMFLANEKFTPTCAISSSRTSSKFQFRLKLAAGPQLMSQLSGHQL